MNRVLSLLMSAGMSGLVMYLLMVYAFKTSTDMAVNRSLIFASVALIYMVMFGRMLPVII
jgi:uncharacterized membrane-anchored protein